MIHKIYLLIIAILLIFQVSIFSQATFDCSLCHSANNTLWQNSKHAKTQLDVASELSANDIGVTPSALIADENCIACHGATSVSLNNGMTESDAMSYFFSTTGGVFTDSSKALHTDIWPHVNCVTCHNVPIDHPNTMPTLGIFNSMDAQYKPISNTSKLCGQCHGSLRFSNTDHLKMDAWLDSKHGHGGQEDVGSEIAVEWSGYTPADVIGEEDCIACHASTSVLENGGMTEVEALNLFFTTVNGKFTSATIPQNVDMWTQTACTSCHNPHDPGALSYFNSSTKSYEAMSSSEELCGQCHGNLRFSGTDHLSYNIAQGTGGEGVPDLKTMGNSISCVDCHMHTGTVDGSKAAMFGGHSWKVFITEDDGSVSTSCTSCHSTMNSTSADSTIKGWKNEFTNLDSAANEKVAAAQVKLQGSSDTELLAFLAEAQFNLTYAESDESGGVHNHKYSISLLNDAIAKATTILTGVNDNANTITEFRLYQNYPNPFNPTTIIKFSINKAQNVSLLVYSITGQLVIALINNKHLSSGNHSAIFDAANLPSGVYLYVIKTKLSGRITKKMVLLK